MNFNYSIMKIISNSILLIIFSLIIGTTFLVSDSYATHATASVSAQQGTAVPGCETTNECFIPYEVTVDVGGVVTWSNDDSAAHTVTSRDASGGPSGVFDSSLFMAGTTFSYEFEATGNYPYYCMVHPWMQGVVIVEQGGVTPSPLSITVKTNSNSYTEGDTIFVSGEVSEILFGYAVSLMTIAPNGDVVSIDQLMVGSDKKFSTVLSAGGSDMKAGGEYTIQVLYGTENRTAETSFTFPGSSGSESNLVQVQGTDFMLGFTITGGKLLSIYPDKDAGSLIIGLDAFSDGTLFITIPRDLLDAKRGSNDDRFFVLVDGEEVDFDETKTSTDRTLTIASPAGTEEIEILGTKILQAIPYSKVQPTPIDSDGDGYSDSSDSCPTQKETFNGYQDSDGCPDVYPTQIKSRGDIVIAQGSSVSGCEENRSCYLPYRFDVGKGSVVTWHNVDSTGHTVTSGTPSAGSDDVFDSSVIASNGLFSQEFSKDGVFNYFCMVHPWMTGQVNVQRSGTVIGQQPVVEFSSSAFTGNPPITVKTNSNHYNEGDTIFVSGEVSKVIFGYAVSLMTIAPNGNVVSIDQLMVGSDKKFSTELDAGGSLMQAGGEYTIQVLYGTENRTAETSFTFPGSTGFDSNLVQVEGTDFMIEHAIIGGNLLSITPDVNANSLIMGIDARVDGQLGVILDRELIDAKIGEVDFDYFVLIDGKKVDFEETTSLTDRTLTIPFPVGAEEIEIIGTHVVPEFGAIAALILAVAILSIIAVSAKSRLSIIPRY